MRYVPDTPLQIAHRVWQLRPPRPSMTVIIKGTFELRPDGPAVIAEEQVPPTGEVFVDDDTARPLRVPSDFALIKPRGEALLVGKAFAPAGRPERLLACGFRVGPIQKRFAVVGDRRWSGTLLPSPGEAEPFQEMDLHLERAYGGHAYRPNPHGRGRDEVERDGRAERILPNLEQPDAMIGGPSDAPPPVILGPLPVTWPSRQKLAGTYDARYVRERWPWLPDDFDVHFFLEGPADQWIDGFFRGDEAVELHHLHRAHPSLRSRLPGIRPRVLIEMSDGDAQGVTEVPVRLDTVVWDGELGGLTLLWRGVVEVPSESLEEVPHLFVAHDPIDDPRPVAELAARLRALLAAEEHEEVAAEGVAPPDFDEEPPTMVASDFEDGAEPPTVIGADAVAAADADPADDVDARLAALDLPSPPEPPPPIDPAEKLAQLRAAGVDLPPAVSMALEEAAARRAEEFDAHPGTVFDPMAGPPVRERLKGRIQDGESLRGIDLTGADLRGLDLGGVDLSGAILRDASLDDANLERASLAGANLDGASLEGAVLRQADLRTASLAGVRASRADLSEAQLDDADLTGAVLRRAILRRARAPRVVLIGADLSEASCSQADLLEADLDGARLVGADLTQVRLTDANLEQAVADEARFDGSEMVRARAGGIHAEQARFRQVDAAGSFWEEGELPRVDFSGARLDDADFSDAVLMGACFDGASMRKARLDRIQATSFTARKADLFEASLEGADIGYADLRGANLYDVALWRANVDGVQVENANLAGTPWDPGA